MGGLTRLLGFSPVGVIPHYGRAIRLIAAPFRLKRFRGGERLNALAFDHAPPCAYPLAENWFFVRSPNFRSALMICFLYLICYDDLNTIEIRISLKTIFYHLIF